MSPKRPNIVVAYIAFGANLSNPRQTFLQVIDALALAGIEVAAVSSLWRSPAWPSGSGAPDYINAVVRVQTRKLSSDLMGLLLEIERDLGRTRSTRNAPRTCDLDLIDWGGHVSDDADCTLPHPRMHERDFVLLPMAEVVEEGWRHPRLKMSVRQLIAALPHQ